MLNEETPPPPRRPDNFVDPTGDARSLDDRTGFGVAEVLARTIAELDPELPDEDAVWEAFIGWTRRDRREYIEAVRRTRHSIFYYQLQELYEFGMERLGRDDVPAVAGRAFADTVYEENLPSLLLIALGSSGSFQDAIVEVFKSYLYRYTGGRYLLVGENLPEETVLTIRSRTPEAGLKYCQQYGLDPLRAFRNSFLYIGGAIGGLFERIVADFRKDGFRLEPLKGLGKIHSPVTASDRFAFEAITQTLIGYIRRVETIQSDLAEDERLESDLIIGSDLMRETWNRIRRASRSEEIVLLRGESGTGKSFIARKIHGLSERRDRPFIEVCLSSDVGSDNMVQSDLFGHEKGAFTGASEQKKGLFSLADGGTIFLDEIGDASGELQAKLLRVMESCTFKRLGGTSDLSVDVRVITATNRDLEKMVENGTFRQDLYYRLNVIPIELPPLRERPEEIPALAELLLARANRGRSAGVRLTETMASRLRGYLWPGNIRELDHAMKHAAAMAEGAEITVVDLPPAARAALESASEVPAAEKEGAPGAPSPPAGGEAGGQVVDTESLRKAVRRLGPAGLEEIGGSAATFDFPVHVDYAKRRYLAVLIDELGGDLRLIGQLWDRGSEKTLRKLVKEYGLAERLEAARERSRRPN